MDSIGAIFGKIITTVISGMLGAVGISTAPAPPPQPKAGPPAIVQPADAAHPRLPAPRD